VERFAIAVAIVLSVVTPALGQVPSPGRVGLTLEGLNVWQERNDVRIPPDSGTPFSISDLIGRASTPSIRAELTVGLTERQELRFVYAPLEISGRGTPSSPIAFAGGQFAAEPTEADYQFSSYRATWRYRVYQGDTWTWRVGGTAFIRDARIALSQPGQTAEDTDVGFVPLGHVSVDTRLSPRWHLAFDLDGSAAPQGRAFDFSGTINYRPLPRLTLSAGYRTIEGGADVESVFAFAWLNAAVARVGVRF
jgi:hypothetical protein